MHKEKDRHHILRTLPSVDQLLNSPKGRALADIYGRPALTGALRFILSQLRKEPGMVSGEFSRKDIMEQAERFLDRKASPSLRNAVNATGIILHTGLGRAVLSQSAIAEIDDVIRGYCTLAVYPDTGRRGNREVHIKNIITEITGAEDATIVNNNAAATILILNTLAKGREVIVSRGQMIEIGGSFRMPEIMGVSGAFLKEVGTTNKTHLKDYVSAVNEKTGAILHVHQSNYRIVGFTEEPSLSELVEVGKRYNLPVIDDIGSGALIDLSVFNVQSEPMVQESIKKGASVVCFSGDKLIGGPQSGIIAGRSEFIEKIRKNPLARAMRVGKMTIAGMEATLKLFLNPEKLRKEHPVYRMLSFTQEELNSRARQVLEGLPVKVMEKAEIEVVDGFSQMGSGSVPTEVLPSKLMSIRYPGMDVEELAKKFRYYKPPIFPRVHKNALLLDFRTIQADEDSIVAKAVVEILGG